LRPKVSFKKGLRGEFSAFGFIGIESFWIIEGIATICFTDLDHGREILS